MSYCGADGCLGIRRCQPCRNIYARATRTRHRDLPDDQRKRANARAYANVYQRRGKLTPQPCEDCGSKRAQKHHDNYDEPLKVRWRCRKCHLRLHGKRARPATP